MKTCFTLQLWDKSNYSCSCLFYYRHIWLCTHTHCIYLYCVYTHNDADIYHITSSYKHSCVGSSCFTFCIHWTCAAGFDWGMILVSGQHVFRFYQQHLFFPRLTVWFVRISKDRLGEKLWDSWNVLFQCNSSVFIYILTRGWKNVYVTHCRHVTKSL